MMRSIVPAALTCLALASWSSAQTLTLTQAGTIPGPADMVKVQDGYAYVSAGKTLTIVDVRNLAAPVRMGTITFPELIWGLMIAGSRVYVACDVAGLAIVDVSNKASPALTATLKTPGQAKNVAIHGTNALVADHIAGIDVVDISSPAMPKLLDSFFVDGFAKDVAVRGSLAYALDQPAGLTILELAKTGGVSPAAAITIRNPIPLRAQLAVSPEAAMPRLAVVVGGGPLQVYDVSNPKAPVAAAVFRTPGAALRVALDRTRAFVADGPAGLQVVDMSVPANPSVMATHKTASPARDVAVDGDTIFVVTGNEGVVMLKASPQ